MLGEEDWIKNPDAWIGSSRIRFLQGSFIKFFRAIKLHFPKYRKFFQDKFFYFLSSESCFLKYNKFFRVSVSGNIWNFFGVSVLRNIRKHKNIFSIRELESFISRNIRKYKNFFIFRAIFAKRSIIDIWQCFEYASGSECIRVLNIPELWLYLS